MAFARSAVHARSVAEHADAVAELLRGLRGLSAEQLPLRAAVGRTLAEPVVSPLDLPVFRNSQMDGFATTAVAVAAAPVVLPVVGTVAAGDPPPLPLAPGAAVRIMTGAPLPADADCIIPVEDTLRVDDDQDVAERVRVERSRNSGEFVREPGTDVRVGAELLKAGIRLAPRHIAVFAAVGLRTVAVHRRPRVAVITTGAELVAAGTALAPGQVYDSNGIALAAALEADGAEVVGISRSTDRLDDFRTLLGKVTREADVVVTSGGVSMGDFEVVKEALLPLGGQFGHVAMQPGGPQGLSTFQGVPVLSFPGNPVSTLVSFEVFLRPLLRAAAGLPLVLAQNRTLRHDVKSIPGKRQFLRGRSTDDGVEVVSGPGSHLVAAMAWADVLVDVPAEDTFIPSGSTVRVLPL